MRVLAVGDSYMPARFFEADPPPPGGRRGDELPRVGVVIDIWPVNPRGSGPPAFD
jgi:hypothetical protein